MNLRIYRAPKLYLGDTRLLTGDRIFVDDLNWIWPGRSVVGILGMDCLRHYCVQLDFANSRMRFLNPNHPEGEKLGKAFPLFFSKRGDVAVRESLAGVGGLYSWIDTGDPNDGSLEKKLYQKELQKQSDAKTKRYETSTGKSGIAALFPTGVFGNETYSKLKVLENPDGDNYIGLRFLARHLVTFNFPKGMMYLRRQSIDPPADDSSFTNAQVITEHPAQ
jgi:hypothetical protein